MLGDLTHAWRKMKWAWLIAGLLMLMLTLAGCSAAPVAGPTDDTASAPAGQPAEIEGAAESDSEGGRIEDTTAPRTELDALLAEAERSVEETYGKGQIK